MSPEAKKEKFDSNTGLKNTSFDSNTINYPKESINRYKVGDEFEWETDFSIDISDNDSWHRHFSPWNIFCSAVVYRNIKLHSNKLMYITAKMLTNLYWYLMRYTVTFYIAKEDRRKIEIMHFIINKLVLQF